MNQQPNIFSFVHISDYIAAVYQTKLDKNPLYSIRKWAKEMGLSSASLLAGVIKKRRRVNQRLAESLILDLNLNEAERSYFEALRFFSVDEGRHQAPTVLDYFKYLREQVLQKPNSTN